MEERFVVVKRDGDGWRVFLSSEQSDYFSSRDDALQAALRHSSGSDAPKPVRIEVVRPGGETAYAVFDVAPRL